LLAKSQAYECSMSLESYILFKFIVPHLSQVKRRKEALFLNALVGKPSLNKKPS